MGYTDTPSTGPPILVRREDETTDTRVESQDESRPSSTTVGEVPVFQEALSPSLKLGHLHPTPRVSGGEVVVGGLCVCDGTCLSNPNPLNPHPYRQ